MLNRRQLLARGATLFVLVPVVACTSSSDKTTPVGPACSGTDVLSSSDDSHTHTVCVLDADMTAPPTAGVTYTTSNAGGHTHQITLTAAQLTSLNSGQSVTVTSTSDSGHTHNFAIKKGNNTGAGGGGGGDPGGGGW